MKLSRIFVGAFLLLIAACGATSRKPGEGARPDETSGGAAGAPGGSAGESTTTCAPPPAALTRLTFDEQVSSVRAVLGDAIADELAVTVEANAADGVFPPLLSNSEGSAIIDRTFMQGDELAQRVGAFVREHFELTACADADFDCVREYVADLGERAFRRPLSEEERTALLLVVDKAEALGVTTATAAEYGVYAIFESPHFLYRTEFGEADPELAADERKLTDYELASLLAYYLTGAPPDAELLSAASAGELGSEAELTAQAGRLLQLPSSRPHLLRLLSDYFRVSAVSHQVFDPAVFPGVTPALIAGMQSELEALLTDASFSGGVGNLLTTPRAHIDATLAELYGVPFPPAGTTPDAAGFVDVDLPSERAGLLTRAGWVASTARPDRESLVERGIQIMTKVLCVPPPEFPDVMPTMPTDGLSEREIAEQRMSTAPCKDCHVDIDPLGIALGELDGLGRLRREDAEGRPIDAAITLPEFAGGANVDGASELSTQLPEELFARCLSQRFLEYAVSASGAALPDQCEPDALSEARVASGDQSLANVLTQIAASRSFRLRKL